MKPFLDADFLLPDDSSRRLFAAVADQPILDFHCHLPPADVARDAPLRTIAHAWLGGDAHKWRAMRLNGVPEADITGHEPDYSTFLAWARTVPKLVGSPLYHWTHLELRRCFGIQETLCERTAPAIWEACNAQLATPAFGARALLTRMQVRAVCTTDDPTDSLEHHVAYAAVRKPSEPVMVPGFRADKAMAVEDPAVWNAYLDRLEAAASLSISSYRDLVTALDRRHAAFHAQGCRASDHALVAPPASFVTPEALGYQFANLRKGVVPSGKEAEAFRTALLLEVGRMDARRGWVMQLHLGAIRNLNTPMFQKLGPDSGFDGAADEKIGKKLAAFLDTLQREGLLPKMVLYSLNPNDYEVLTSIMGCFQEGALPGKCQLGSAWWFNHHIEGMRRQMTALANLGQLSRFVGMPTDSRSFLSFPRHEYFRRILCALVGGWIEAGEAPADFETFGAMVQDIAYRNARDYFALPGLED